MLTTIMYTAHIIRNRTSTSTAICSLDALSRWAVTGTPIQNSLADLSGLLRFLRFRPYDDSKVFDSEIIDFFRRDDINEGTRRLQALCRPFMLRRSLGVITLPPRQDLVKTVDFSKDEEFEYRKTEAAFENYPEHMIDTHSGLTWINTIQLINRLRIFCNLGLASSSAGPTEAQSQLGSETSISKDEESPEAILASQLALGCLNCVQCQQIIDTPEDHTTVESAHAYYSQCRRLVYCKSCAGLCNYQSTIQCACTSSDGHCALRMLSLELVRTEPSLSTSLNHLSSKVRALVTEVVAGLPEKRYVI